MTKPRATAIKTQGTGTAWREVFSPEGAPRPAFQLVLRRMRALPRADLRLLEDRIEATLREMGVTFDVDHDRSWGVNPWNCDILPQVFSHEEWETIEQGVAQRLRAFEAFLADIYGPKRILHEGVLPVDPILGSPYYQGAVSGIRPPENAYLHLSGICLSRLASGRLAVKHHYFSHASGMAYMIQNRRALARVNPSLFAGIPIHLVADTPLAILEELRNLARSYDSEPTVVLLTPGTRSAAYSEHSLLARRMGIPLVQGNDLLVLDDKVFVKTISGLERVEVIYTRVSDAFIDPLVFRADSLLGVPGLVQCIRKGTVAVVNSLGSQLADDRAILPLSQKIIRYYLGEHPLLPTVPTRWLGDIDECIHVLDHPNEFLIRPCYGEAVLGRTSHRQLTAGEISRIRAEVAAMPGRFVAQPLPESAVAVAFRGGREVEVRQDHLFFAVRTGPGAYRVLPGALTRISSPKSRLTASELGGGSKDTWILRDEPRTKAGRATAPAQRDYRPPAHAITSRVAESFYWLGRYLERAHSLGYLIATVETLETEELNSAERELYQPMFSRLLPPLESGGIGRPGRSIATWRDRYRLVVDQDEPGSVVSTVRNVISNAESLQDLLSAEAWAILANLRDRFARVRYRPACPQQEGSSMTRRLTDIATSLIPQLLATAEMSMLLDDGWHFCETGVLIERAVITANAMVSTLDSFRQQIGARERLAHDAEIEFSAFLRLLGSRDAYRRVHQMRAAPAEVLELLWKHPEGPRSVRRCLLRVAQLLEESLLPASTHGAGSVRELRALAARLESIDWNWFFARGAAPAGELPAWSAGFQPLPKSRPAAFAALMLKLMDSTLEMHGVVSDSFLSHQARIRESSRNPNPNGNDAF